MRKPKLFFLLFVMTLCLFAYSLNDKTVVRGGYGLFYSVQAFNAAFLESADAFNSVTPFVGTIDNGATPFTTIAKPFPNGLRQPIGAAVGLASQLGDAVSFWSFDRVSPLAFDAVPGAVVTGCIHREQL